MHFSGQTGNAAAGGNHVFPAESSPERSMLADATVDENILIPMPEGFEGRRMMLGKGNEWIYGMYGNVHRILGFSHYQRNDCTS